MWIDATVAGGILENPKQSQVAGKVGYAPAPIAVTANGSHWRLWVRTSPGLSQEGPLWNRL